MEKELFSLEGDRNQLNLLLGIGLIILLILLVFYPSMIQIYWPYLIMTLIVLLAYNFKDAKLTATLFILLMAIMILMQVTFYFIIPMTHNYQPTPTIPKMQIFDLAGKFQVSYYPDIPEAGDEILLYFEICDIGLVNCTPCQICALSGNFINEKNEIKTLFLNVSTNNTEPIIFSYPGRKVEITLNFEGIDKRYDTFYIPKLNFIQAIVYFYREHIIFSILSIFSLFIFILGIPYSIYRIIRRSKKKISSSKEKKLKVKIQKILNST